MRRDSIFYQLFQQSPTLIFELIPNPPENVEAYRFDSVAVKEPKFEIDGVFLPPEDDTGTVFFCEVQFQKDEALYERAFAESALYFYRNRSRFSDWEMVFIYPSRSAEQTDIRPHRSLLNGNQVHTVYLDELGDIRQLPLWVGLMVLTTVKEDVAPIEARYLLSRSREELSEPEIRVIMSIVAGIISYRFGQISRREVEKMLGITLEGTKVYQEIRQEAQVALVVKLLRKRFGELTAEFQTRIEQLSSSELEELVETQVDFRDLSDVQSWFEAIALASRSQTD